MFHIQGPTLNKFYFYPINGIITDTAVQRRSKATDMHFYWICDQFRQKNHVNWENNNDLANYLSKHYPTQHQISVLPTYVPNTIKKQAKTLLK